MEAHSFSPPMAEIFKNDWRYLEMLPPADYFSIICLPQVLCSLSKKKKKKKSSYYSITRSSKYYLKKKTKQNKEHQSLN